MRRRLVKRATGKGRQRAEDGGGEASDGVNGWSQEANFGILQKLCALKLSSESIFD